MRTNSRARRRIRTAAMVVVGLVLGVTTVSAAHAAPPWETEATLTQISFVSETVESGQRAELTGSWSLPNDPATPAGFVVDLPAGLSGLSDSFELRAPTGETVGRCVVTRTQIVCDIDADYIAGHPRNLKGTFEFWAEVNTQVTETTAVTYDFGDVSATVEVTPGSSCPGCTFEGKEGGKWGTYDSAADTFRWGVEIASPKEGMPAGQTVTVRERLGADQEWVRSGDGSPAISIVGTDQLDARGFPTGWQTVTSQVGMTLSETPGEVAVTFTTQEGWFYAVNGYSRPTDGGAAVTYTNEADFTVEGQETKVVRAQVVRHAGGGTGSGDRVGDFAITKHVDWYDAPVDGVTFTGTYTVTAPGGEVSDGTFEVADGGTWTSPEYEAGSTAHVTETRPKSSGNFDWAEPVFSTNDFVIDGGETVAVTLTNTTRPIYGQFMAMKAIEGDGASLVASDAVFTLAYSYPAGEGFSAGSGPLELPADGTLVASELLPIGAQLTFWEVDPAPVDGASWGEPRLSVTSLKIDHDGGVYITVTNTLTANPGTPTPTPTASAPGTSPTPEAGVGSEFTEAPTPAPAGELAVTGGQPPYALLAVGGVLLVLGLIARRRAASGG